MPITPIDIIFLGPAAWAAVQGLKAAKAPAEPAPPATAPEDTAHGAGIPGMCAGRRNVVPAMGQAQMLARYIAPGGTFKADITRPVPLIHMEIDEWTGECWRIIKKSTLRRTGSDPNWPAFPAAIFPRWNGKNQSGREMPSDGIYRVRIWAPGTLMGGYDSSWLKFGIFAGKWSDGGSNFNPSGSLGGGGHSGRGGGGMLNGQNVHTANVRNSALRGSAVRAMQLGDVNEWAGSIGKGIGVVDSTCCQFGWDWCCKSDRRDVTPLPTPAPPAPIIIEKSVTPAWLIPAAVATVALGAVYMIARPR